MSTETTRVAILPRGVASRVITSAIALSAWGVGVVVMLLTVPVVVDVLVSRGLGDRVWVPLLCVLAMLGLLALCLWRPGIPTRLVYLGVGGVLSLVYSVSLLTSDRTLNDDAAFVLNRLALVLVLGGVSVVRPAAGLLWSFAGYAVAMGAALASALVAGVSFAPGWGPTLALLVYAGAFAALAAIRATQERQIPDLVRLEEDTRRLSIENQFEQRAAAIVHDTVLSDLTVVMNSAGPLHPRARDRFRADVATLGDAAWLRESADASTIAPHDAALRNSLEKLVSDFQWRGLTVDVTGDSDAVVRISTEAASALVAAVRSCLDNVLDHAGTASAELVIATTDDAVTVMVIDHGTGFDPGTVADDRLGLRWSVVKRIRLHGGSVRVWSTPGSGTSVLIRVPGAAAAEQPEAGRVR